MHTVTRTKLMGWSGGAMVLGKLPLPGRPAILDYSRARASVLAVGVVGVVWTFFLSSGISFPSPILWEMARYRLKYCLKGPLNQNNQPSFAICLQHHLLRFLYFRCLPIRKT